MTVNVNPDPHAEGFTPQPIYNVTAVFDELNDVISAVRSLKQYGFSDERTSVFRGKEGLARLDLHGEDHGVLARVIRALESLTAEEQANVTLKQLSRKDAYLLLFRQLGATSRRRL